MERDTDWVELEDVQNRMLRTYVSFADKSDNVPIPIQKATSMLFRAKTQMLALFSQRSSKRRFYQSPLESLEPRCLLSVGTPTVNLATGGVTITATSGEDLVIAANGTNLTYKVDNGAVQTLGSITAASITSLLVNCTSSSGSNKITLNLSESIFTSLLQARVTAGGGVDTVNASGSDVLVSLDGGAGNDVLIGGQAISGGTTINVPHIPSRSSYQLQNTLIGGSGNDVLIGGAGNDSMLGGSENDTMSGGDGDDNLVGGDGNDKMSGGGGSDSVNGNAGEDSLTGGAGNDYVYGGAGRDTLTGGDDEGAGFDVVKGQGGRDYIVGTQADAILDVATLNTDEPIVDVNNPNAKRSLDLVNDPSSEYLVFVFSLGFVPLASSYP